MGKYSDEVLGLKISAEVNDGIRPEKTFFAITDETLRDVYHVLPTDSVEEAKRKIMDVVTQDEFLYNYFHKDPRDWELKEFTPGYWTGHVKEEQVLSKNDIKGLGFDDEELSKMRMPVKKVKIIPTFEQKLTIRFVKRQPSNIMNDRFYFDIYEKEFQRFLAQDNVYTQILKGKFAVREPQKKETFDPNKLLVIPDVELHIGKLASKFDSTDSYDYKKALYRYMKIILDAKGIQEKYKASQICMTIGNDFFNTDTEKNTTTAGTEQHNDTRFEQMIANGIVAHIWAIEQMKMTCEKLILKFNPGNHDYQTDYQLFMQLYYLYRNDPRVEIEPLIKDVRWATGLNYGNNLIIFAHGKTPEGRPLSDDDLASLKDGMFKEAATGVKNIAVCAGHLHNASQNNFSRRKTTASGVTVLRNGSPCGDGAWDSGNNYSSDKSHQVYVFDYDKGLDSTHNITFTARELEKGISIPPLTDNTNYVKAVESSIDSQTETILQGQIRDAYAQNETAIKKVKKKYDLLLKRVEEAMLRKGMTTSQKAKVLEALGLNEELAPLLATRDMLKEQLDAPKRTLKQKEEPKN